jgi:cell division inhibitor SepF
MTRPSTPVVRAIPNIASAKPHVISPASFNDAQEVADKYKGSQPVIINLQAVDRDLSRRIIDFASGLCYGLGGSMDKVAHQVYLLTPGGVEVSAEERRRLQERGLYD